MRRCVLRVATSYAFCTQYNTKDKTTTLAFAHAPALIVILFFSLRFFIHTSPLSRTYVEKLYISISVLISVAVPPFCPLFGYVIFKYIGNSALFLLSTA